MSETTKAENLRPGWKPGQSGNPKGRPRGSRNRVTLVALAAMEEGADAIARKVVDMAKEGDISAARLVIERLVPVAKERPIFLALPDTGSAEGVAQAQAAILQAVAAGDLLPGEAATLAGIVEARRKAVETLELEQRITALEGRNERIAKTGQQAGRPDRGGRTDRLHHPVNRAWHHAGDVTPSVDSWRWRCESR
jgi:hypothetical protein